MPTTKEDRKALHAYVSDDAHETWHQVAADQGVSVSAVLQVLGDLNPEQLAEILNQTQVPVPARQGHGTRDVSLTIAARNIDANRRRRR